MPAICGQWASSPVMPSVFPPERFDGLATIANGTKHLVVYGWYDNEYGYSNQVVRFVENIAGKRPRVLPHRSPISEL